MRAGRQHEELGVVPQLEVVCFGKSRKKTKLAPTGLLAVQEAVKSSTCDAELK